MITEQTKARKRRKDTRMIECIFKQDGQGTPHRKGIWAEL